MQNRDPYTTPASDLGAAQPAGGGSVEQALQQDMGWRIGDVMGEAWQLVSGFKGSYWAALLVYALVSFAIGFVVALLAPDSVMMAALGEVLSTLVTLPIFAGLYVLAIHRAAGREVTWSQVLQYFEKMLPLFLLFILVSLFTTIGFILLILPGIYLMIAYLFSIPLMVEKHLSIWDAMESSRKSISRCWFRMFGVFLLIILLLIVSAIPLGLGLIWSIPWAALCFGVIYREMYGVEQ